MKCVLTPNPDLPATTWGHYLSSSPSKREGNVAEPSDAAASDLQGQKPKLEIAVTGQATDTGTARRALRSAAERSGQRDGPAHRPRHRDGSERTAKPRQAARASSELYASSHRAIRSRKR